MEINITFSNPSPSTTIPIDYQYFLGSWIKHKSFLSLKVKKYILLSIKEDKINIDKCLYSFFTSRLIYL